MKWQEIADTVFQKLNIPYYDDAPEFASPESVPPLYIVTDGWETYEHFTDDEPNFIKANITVHIFAAKRPSSFLEELRSAMEEADFCFISGGKLSGGGGSFPRRMHYYQEFSITLIK